VPPDAGHRHVHPQAAAPQPDPALRTDELNRLIHVPARLKIAATLAALPDGDALSFTRLPDMIGLTPGNLLIHLRKPEQAGYLTSEKTGNGAASRTTLALTRQSRTALASCTAALRDLPGGL
jgi:DNA-binding transcriptional ArsR family regulator